MDGGVSNALGGVFALQNANRKISKDADFQKPSVPYFPPVLAAK